MSEVKKISPVGNIYGWEESQFGEFVLSQDYEALADEAQALREEVAALRARVAVVPDRLPRSSDIAAIHQHSIGWNACLDELARLNGLTVSEGLLRRLCEPLLSHADYVVVRDELRALFNEDKENGNG
ncbi:TPA: hypothetical protein NID63_001967 [Pseudomonas aeruginosa]|uniref:hypothetical protein n=1 Tax=Pseudomonas aeruginosa TaxID=287 RepID=UPI0003B99742|nr:hypothetical protein [Pseudomonas aeruginosa]ASA14168.1 hypothetical protein CDL16_08065 [Pseudomonas aeruginosa]AVK20254.1 hypothetical protein CSB90_5544 [Pseudomonas aeruginosa]EIU3603711.1 hypothetical protein [Pseudomonas aeruginosa]EIU3799889.1 hypothetical protein [Pseudomonas aeruginosa]EJK6083370.1 hypothetical protein [Pseudomonas aeruginosa]